MGLSKQMLFVIDGDLATRQRIAALTWAVGIRCEVFLTAEQFLGHWDRSCNGCLLASLPLGGLSAKDLRDAMVKRGNPLPMILISPGFDAAAADRAVKDGAYAVFVPPFAADQLLAAIRNAIHDNLRNEKGASTSPLPVRHDRVAAQSVIPAAHWLDTPWPYRTASRIPSRQGIAP